MGKKEDDEEMAKLLQQAQAETKMVPRTHVSDERAMASAQKIMNKYRKTFEKLAKN